MVVYLFPKRVRYRAGMRRQPGLRHRGTPVQEEAHGEQSETHSDPNSATDSNPRADFLLFYS